VKIDAVQNNMRLISPKFVINVTPRHVCEHTRVEHASCNTHNGHNNNNIIYLGVEECGLCLELKTSDGRVLEHFFFHRFIFFFTRTHTCTRRDNTTAEHVVRIIKYSAERKFCFSGPGAAAV